MLTYRDFFRRSVRRGAAPRLRQPDSVARNRCRSFAVRAPSADRGASMKRRLAAVVLGVVVVVGGVSCTTVKTRVWMNQGHKLYKAERYDEAVEFYKKIGAIDPR